MLPSESTVHCGTIAATFRTDFTTRKVADRLGLRLFRAWLPAYEHLLPYLTDLLQSAELQRARRYYHQKDQRRFSICRGLLKILLAESTGINPKNILLDYHSNKKPYLASHPALFFNISHAGDYALFALADRPVGVDVEKLRYDFPFRESLPHILSAAEVTVVQQAADPTAAFYGLWTRKEALVKAVGKGIDDDFWQVPATDGLHTLPPTLLGSTECWQVHSFAVAEGHVGAVACAGAGFVPDPLSFCALPTTLDELLREQGRRSRPTYSFSE